MSRSQQQRPRGSDLAETIRAAAAETVRAATSAASDVPRPASATRGQSNVVVATNVGRSGTTTGAFAEQTADTTRQGVLTDDGWNITEQRTTTEA